MTERTPKTSHEGGRAPRDFARSPSFILLALLLAAPGAWALLASRSDVDGAVDCRVEAVWGIRGVQPGEMHFPRAVQPAPDGSIYVVDRSGRVQQFDPSGKTLASWRLPAWSRGTPTGLEWDPGGRLIVVNSHYSDLLFYSPEGRLEGRLGGYGERPEQMIVPTDAALGPNGFLYVVERGGTRDRVAKFTRDGAFVSEWGGLGREPGQFQRPQGIACDERGRLWVADSCNHRLQVFDAEGTLLMVVGESGEGRGQMRYPYDVAAGPGGRMIVAEYGNNRLQIFSSEGRSLGIVGGAGREPGRFASPWGVACDAQGMIWVADTLNHRMQALRIDWPD
jgi:DNA-binding beta-propeller fold protein YncE